LFAYFIGKLAADNHYCCVLVVVSLCWIDACHVLFILHF